MQTKLIELRDRATFIPAIATLMESDDPQERYLLGRAGYRGTRCVLLARLSGGECHYDCYEWRYEPWRTAHEWLIDHWDEVKSGDVLDGEFLRGGPHQAERDEAPTFDTSKRWDGGVHNRPGDERNPEGGL